MRVKIPLGVVAWELGRLRETQVQKLSPSRLTSAIGGRNIGSSRRTRLLIHAFSFGRGRRAVIVSA